MDRKNIGLEEATQKIKHFCSYQERCHSEVKQKLYSMGLYPRQIEAIMADLINAHYLNEDRFAIAYAGGKFRMLKWGKIKIYHSLKQKGVSEYCIKRGLKEIPLDDYLQTLNILAEKKFATLKGSLLQKQLKLKKFLLDKGFESSLITQAMDGL